MRVWVRASHREIYKRSNGLDVIQLGHDDIAAWSSRNWLLTWPRGPQTNSVSLDDARDDMATRAYQRSGLEIGSQTQCDGGLAAVRLGTNCCAIKTNCSELGSNCSAIGDKLLHIILAYMSVCKYTPSNSISLAQVPCLTCLHMIHAYMPACTCTHSPQNPRIRPQHGRSPNI